MNADPASPRRPVARPKTAAAPASDGAPRAPTLELPPLARDPFLTPEEEEALNRPEPPPRPVRRAKKAAPAELRLEALIVPDDGRRKIAIVNGRPFAEGERIGDEELVSIGRDHIELVSATGVHRRVEFDKGRNRGSDDGARGSAASVTRN